MGRGDHLPDTSRGGSVNNLSEIWEGIWVEAAGDDIMTSVPFLQTPPHQHLRNLLPRLLRHPLKDLIIRPRVPHDRAVRLEGDIYVIAIHNQLQQTANEIEPTQEWIWGVEERTVLLTVFNDLSLLTEGVEFRLVHGRLLSLECLEVFDSAALASTFKST